MSYQGLKAHQLETKTFAESGRVVVSMYDLPPRRQIRHIMERLETQFTGTAGGTVAGSALHQLIASIIIGKHHRSTGQTLRALNWLMRGKEYSLPAGVPAVANTYRRAIGVMIPYADDAAASPKDTARNTELFKDEPIELQFAATATVSANLNATGTTGTLRSVAFHEPSKPGKLNSDTEISYADWSQATIFLPPGFYSHLCVMRESGAVITDAQISNVLAYADGDVIYNNLPSVILADLYDWYRAEGGGLRTDTSGATVPVQGEELTEQPAVTAAAAATISMEFLPLVTPPDKYELGGLLNAESGVRLDFTGSDTSFRIPYRRIVERSPQSVHATAAKIGVPEPMRAKVKVQTKSGKPFAPGGPLGRVLPLKFS